MHISIIVPTLNEAASIQSVLDCCQIFRRHGHEVIVADGGSQDETLALAEPLVDQIVHSPAGRAEQMNKAAAEATGSLLWFLHADTWVPEDALSALGDTLVVQPLTCWGRFDVCFDHNGWQYRVIAYFMNKRSRWTSVATGDQGIFISRDLFDDCDGFAPIALMEDIEICKRLRRICKPVNLTVRLMTSSRRWETAGWLRTVVLMWFLRLAYFLGVSPGRLVSWYRRDVR